jgi:hypothetical protein
MTTGTMQWTLLTIGVVTAGLLAGCAGMRMASSSPPVQGSVTAGNVGNDGCISGTTEYVTFYNGGSGYTPSPSSAQHCTIQLTNSSGYYFKTSEYVAAFNEYLSPGSFVCMTPTNNNAYTAQFNTPQALGFTISFTGSPPPPAGSKVYLLMNWR